MDEAALMLESSNDAIARIATRVGYETTTAFSKAFKTTPQLLSRPLPGTQQFTASGCFCFALKADMAVA